MNNKKENSGRAARREEKKKKKKKEKERSKKNPRKCSSPMATNTSFTLTPLLAEVSMKSKLLSSAYAWASC